MYQAIKRSEAVTVTPQARKFRTKSGQFARSRADRKTGSEDCSVVFSEPAFVKQRFLPLITAVPDELKEQQKVEQGFFNSLHHLCKAYGIEPMDFSDVPYPLNLRQHLLYLRPRLRAKHPDLSLHVVKGIIDVATLSTVRTFDTGRTLYYIPVEPLHNLQELPERKQTAALLTSVFSYLHGVVKVDHFAENGSYLKYVYAVLTDWAEDFEEECNDLKERFHEIEAAGEYNLGLISDEFHVLEFGERIARFEPVSPADTLLFELAKKFYALSLDYSQRSIYERILELYDVDDYEYGVIRLSTYLSFYWSDRGIEYQQVIDYVDGDLQECVLMDEPSIAHYFDRPADITCENFEFEKRLFELIDDLCVTLKNLNDEYLAKN